MNRSSAHQISRRRRATTVPVVALTLLVLLGCVAFAVDVGYIYSARGEMQRSVDASALAGASGLGHHDQDHVVRQRSIAVAGQNPVAGAAVTQGELDMVIGNWRRIGGSFSFTPLDGNETHTPNALHVTGTRTDMPLYFARALGVDTTTVIKEAVAMFGAGRCAGIWGLDEVTCEGDVYVDSYDTDAGPYGPSNRRSNGDLCSCGDIVVDGDIEIHGDAMYGDGYSFIPSGSTWEVWGMIDDHACGTPPFDADFAAVAADNDNATIGLTINGRDPFGGSPWDLYVTGNDGLVLNGGTYYFTSVLIDGQAVVTVNDPTKIYITGPAVFTGGGICNVGQHPPDLLVYSSGPTLYLKGTSGFYGAVIAPNTDVSIVGTGDLYGTILARTLDFDGDAVVHVDETLVYDLFGIKSVAPVLVK
jgi:hypothetical protein